LRADESAGSQAGRSGERPSALTRPAAEPAQAFFRLWSSGRRPTSLSQPRDSGRASDCQQKAGDTPTFQIGTMIYRASRGSRTDAVRRTLKQTCAEPAPLAARCRDSAEQARTGCAILAGCRAASPQARAPAIRPARQPGLLSPHPISSTTSRPSKCAAGASSQTRVYPSLRRGVTEVRLSFLSRPRCRK
jgi:hypothetical protein